MFIACSLIIIESSLSDLNPSERRVAEYILEHPDEIINICTKTSRPNKRQCGSGC